ncbi:MAG: hypothetical protein J5994_10900 [Ruminococcus sp.]|nr:hypothetical protein [Ruminococcus sp.]
MNNRLLDIMDRFFDRKFKEKQIPQREAAVVVSVSEGCKRAVVRLAGDASLELLNKSGEKLYEGDSVWIEYRTAPSGGYIAMRNGEADPLGSGAAFIIENAAVLTADEGQELTAEQEIVNVDTASRTTTVYGNPKNTVIVGGNRWLFCADTAELKLRASPEDAVTDAEFYINDTAWSYMTRLSSMAKTAEGFSWTVGLWRRKSGSTDNWGNIANLTVTEEPASFGIVCRAQSMSENTTCRYGSTTYQTPNGYVLGRMNIAAFSADGSVISVSEITSNVVSWQRFSSAAERDYAFAVTTRSEISEVTENV